MFEVAEICAEIKSRYPKFFDGTDPLDKNLPKLSNCNDGVLASLLVQCIEGFNEFAVGDKITWGTQKYVWEVTSLDGGRMVVRYLEDRFDYFKKRPPNLAKLSPETPIGPYKG